MGFDEVPVVFDAEAWAFRDADAAIFVYGVHFVAVAALEEGTMYLTSQISQGRRA